jgi:hypothetical protein
VCDTLALFEKSTGQNLSPAKCSLMYWDGSDESLVNEVKHILCIQRVGFDERCLGLPLLTGRNKRGQFQSMEERYVKRMGDWWEQTLS